MPYLRLPPGAAALQGPAALRFPLDLGVVTELSCSAVLSALRLTAARANSVGRVSRRRRSPTKPRGAAGSFSGKRAALLYAALSRLMLAGGNDGLESDEVGWIGSTPDAF